MEGSEDGVDKIDSTSSSCILTLGKRTGRGLPQVMAQDTYLDIGNVDESDIL